MQASEPTSIFSLTNHELYVVTAAHNGKENGQIASWIFPATLVAGTPRLVAVLSPMNFTYQLIRESRRFTVQLLSANQDDLVPRFGLLTGKSIDKFRGLSLQRTASGLPLLEGTCGWIECTIIDEIDSGDRMIVLAEVVEQQVYPDKYPLRKLDAFMKLPVEIRMDLMQKATRDGERDAALMKMFNR